jgi:hypothetical protein
MYRPLFFLCFTALAPAFAKAPSLPYGVSPEMDVPLGLGLYALKMNSDGMLARTRAENPWSPALEKSSIPAYDRWIIGNYSPNISAMSSVVAGAEMLIPLAANAADVWTGRASWSAFVVDALLLQETMMLSGAMSSYAKSVRVHATPISYDPAVPESEKRIPQNASSFFSNHTASAFATAVFSAYTFQVRHPNSALVPWVWGAGLGLASAVGGMRLAAGKHFPSDVLAGAAAGALCGYLIPRIHMGQSWNLHVTIPEGADAVGPAVGFRF